MLAVNSCHLLEEHLKHFVRDLLGPSAVDLVDLLCVRVVGVKAAELALLIPEQEEEVGAVAPVDDVQDALPCLLVHGPGENDVLNRVQDDRPVGLGRRLSVQPGAYRVKVKKRRY